MANLLAAFWPVVSNRLAGQDVGAGTGGTGRSDTAYVGNSLTSALVTGEQAWIAWLGEYPAVAWALAAVAAIAVLLIVWVWRKGRPFAKGDVFRASRLSSGNRLFPTQVLITPDERRALHRELDRARRKKRSTWRTSASVKIQTGMLLSDVLIETSGGTHPIGCHGHHKGDATAMKQLIERYQTDYYQKGAAFTGHGHFTLSRGPVRPLRPIT